MSNLFSELLDLKSKYDEKIEKEGKKALKEAFKEIFLKHSCVDKVVFTAYTPYFSDGDENVYSVNEFNIIFKKPTLKKLAKLEKEKPTNSYMLSQIEETLEGDCSNVYGNEASSWTDYANDPEVSAAAKAVYDLERSIPEDVIRSVFGDHIKVTITKSKIEVEEYSHE
jgi:hypothetical protein